MVDVQIDPSSPVPLYEQVAAEIRRALANGECRPGERLPPARDLAAVLGVNRNTVLHAMRELREEGVLEFSRGRGVTVSATPPTRVALVDRVHDLVAFAREHGYARDELVTLVQQLA